MAGLQANTLGLEFRVGNLEENSGDDGNSSIAELELRVDSLEDVTGDQETRIVAAEENIQGEKRKLCKLSRHFNGLYFTL